MTFHLGLPPKIAIHCPARFGQMADTADNPDNDHIPTPVWNLEDDTKPAFVM